MTTAGDTVESLNALQLWDFCIVRFFDGAAGETGGDVLLIHASNDFTYYRNAEIRFTGTTWVACPVRFSHAQFRLATLSEAREASRRSGGAANEGTVWCIEADTGVFAIAAQRVEVAIETVKYNASP